jgi:hypothetical protein
MLGGWPKNDDRGVGILCLDLLLLEVFSLATFSQKNVRKK